MRYRIRTILLSAAVVAVMVNLPVQAEPQSLVLRAQSADAATDALRRLAARLEEDATADLDIDGLLGIFGLPDAAWIDRSRPLALAFPLRGMALGMKGMVGVFPVRDGSDAAGAIGEILGGGAPDDEGIRSYPRTDGSAVYVMTRGGYLGVSLSRSLLPGLDPASLLELPGAPPGRLVAEIDVEAVAPIALMGLESAKQMLASHLVDASGEESGEDDAAGAPGLDPAAAGRIADVYLTYAEDLLKNTSRLQVALEVNDDELIVHKRLVPRAGSTLAGLIEAQSGGLPDVSRLLEPDASIAYAGRLTFTAPFVAAVDGYLKTYGSAMAAMGGVSTDPAGDGWSGSVKDLTAAVAGRWSACHDGGFAGTIDLDAERGIRGAYVAGLANPELCRDLLDRIVAVMSDLPALPEGASITVKEAALEYRGVRAYRQDSTVGTADESAGDLDPWFSDGSALTYFGLAGKRFLSATGADAERDFMQLVDRSSGEVTAGGLVTELFAPLKIGAGVYIVADLERISAAIDGLAKGAGEGGETRNLADAGRVVAGIRLDDGAMHADLVVRLDLLDRIAALVDGDRVAPHSEGAGDRTGEPNGSSPN